MELRVQAALVALAVLPACAFHVREVDASLFRKPAREAGQRVALVGLARYLLQAGHSEAAVLDTLMGDPWGLSMDEAKGVLRVAEACLECKR